MATTTDRRALRGGDDHSDPRFRTAFHVGSLASWLNPTVAYRHILPDAESEDSLGAKPPGPDDEEGGGVDATATATAAAAGDDGDGGPPRSGKTGGDGSAAVAAIGVWTSRNNRKGRHEVAISHPHPERLREQDVAATDSLGETARGIARMVTRFPVWDVSYDVAVVFTLGSVIWVINGFFVWLPLQAPGTEFDGEVALGGGVTAFIGATIFEVGSVLLMLEAVNERRTECFGWAVERALGVEYYVVRRKDGECGHPHRERGSLVKGAGEDEGGDGDAGEAKKTRAWHWWPTWAELRDHYFRELGFLACLAQMIAASVFWISGLTGLPPILDALSLPATNGIYWLPQVIGGTGFIISSLLFMLETQPKWYIPAPRLLGWHIGLWNLIGAIGFTLCGALGFASGNDAAVYASTLATFIGSWAFLIGSAIQWYESLDKYTVSIGKRIDKRVDDYLARHFAARNGPVEQGI